MPEPEPTPERIATLPKWARDYIRRLKPAQPDEGALVLDGEPPPDSRGFPWASVATVFRRELPEIRFNSSSSRRDAGIKKFWRERGRAIGSFEALCQKVRESDFLMARNGHTGANGRPYSFSLIFDKDRHGRWRFDRIMDDCFSNENMQWLLEKNTKANETQVRLVGHKTPVGVNLDERLPGGGPRFKVIGEHITGLPEVLDYK